MRTLSDPLFYGEEQKILSKLKSPPDLISFGWSLFATRMASVCDTFFSCRTHRTWSTQVYKDETPANHHVFPPVPSLLSALLIQTEAENPFLGPKFCAACWKHSTVFTLNSSNVSKMTRPPKRVKPQPGARSPVPHSPPDLDPPEVQFSKLTGSPQGQTPVRTRSPTPTRTLDPPEVWQHGASLCV